MEVGLSRKSSPVESFSREILPTYTSQQFVSGLLVEWLAWGWWVLQRKYYKGKIREDREKISRVEHNVESS